MMLIHGRDLAHGLSVKLSHVSIEHTLLLILHVWLCTMTKYEASSVLLTQANPPQSSISLVYNSNVNTYQLGSFIFYSYYMYLEYCFLSIHTRQAYAVTKQNCEHSVNQLYCVYIPAGHSDLLNIVGTTYCLADTIKYLIPHTHTLV